MDLITDRTHADCERAAYLLDRAHAGKTLTDAERAEYFGGLRGCYTMAVDWNRVEAAVKEISDRYGMGLHTKTDWTYNDIATTAEIERYMSNIAAVYEIIDDERKKTTPTPPTLCDWIDYRVANNIEKIILAADDMTPKYAILDVTAIFGKALLG